MEKQIKDKILEIIRINSKYDGWAQQAKVCADCKKRGINLKDWGGTKIFSDLEKDGEIESSKDKNDLPILKQKVNDGSSNIIEEKQNCVVKPKSGLFKLGYIANLKECPSILSKMVETDDEVTLKEINEFCESDNFKIEYYDKNNRAVPNEKEAYIQRFLWPQKDKYGGNVYGELTRENLEKNFSGITWKSSSITYLAKFGLINMNSIEILQKTSNNENIKESNIANYLTNKIEYINGGGYAVFQNGTKVTKETGKFLKIETNIKNDKNKTIYIWFTKVINTWEGFDSGDEETFKNSLANIRKYISGRIIFDNIEECNKFYNKLEEKAMKEPWSFKYREQNDISFPILKAYVECELERLFYECDKLNRDNKIIYNKERNKILFNTNLLDKFAHDLNIVGDVRAIASKTYIINPNISPSAYSLGKWGFEKTEPQIPEFFKDINDIIFHCNWRIDNDSEKYEHIIEERRKRFPEKYADDSSSNLSNLLDDAIRFAIKIAQRNYKFIVPMYYPRFQRIQLLMPIFLNKTTNDQPDFALVLTPCEEMKLYRPETILGLEEVYQDARLIAKPDETWLNPDIIGNEK